MPTLPNYNAFAGRHYETGTIANALAWQGARAPHTNAPPSEAMLLGLSGGITVGYFTFAYEGYLPHVSLLTRNTFSPFDTILDRLAIPRDVRQSGDAAKGERNLVAVIEEGSAPIIWADIFSLPFNNFPWDERNWAAQPMICYSLEDVSALLAAGSAQPLQVDRATLSKARGRVKAERFRVMELDAPNFDLLPEAVHKGIAQCIALYTEKPPRGKKENFGLAALRHWATLLVDTRNKQSWMKQFPAGGALYQALIGTPWQPGVLGWIETWGTDGGADRSTYAAFLDEAAAILGKPALREAAAQFRLSYNAWKSLADQLVPVDGPLRNAHDLLLQRHQLFVGSGDAQVEAIRAIDAQLANVEAACSRDFPLNSAVVFELQQGIATQVLAIEALESEAVRTLQGALLG